MDTSFDPLAWLRFMLAPKLTHAMRHKLLEAFGSPEQVFTTARGHVAATLGENVANAIAVEPVSGLLDRALNWMGEENHHFIPKGSPSYPAMLREIADPPLALYVRGRLDLLNADAIAIVGSRNATPQGARDAEAFAQALSEGGLTVVSGLALGIDAAAHRGALNARSSSIAVMGTGADRIYPPRNRELGDRLAQDGALVTEFPLGTPPLALNFPSRNRLISGLARGVLVVEAAMESGSLITARTAGEQGRDVFAMPGSIHAPLSKGCHRLLRDGAKLVECAEDVLAEYGRRGKATPAARIAATRDTDDFLTAMGESPVSVDEIARRTGIGAGAIAARLSALQIDGRIERVAGGLFQRLQHA